MNVVLNITAPIFFLILVGYLSVRYQFLPQASLPGMSRFVLYLALPSLIFIKLSNMELTAVLHFDYLMVYALGGIASFFLMVLLSRLIFKNDWIGAGVKGVGATMSNSAFIGFPVLLQFFDHAPTQAFAMALMVENIILMPMCLIFIEAMLGRDSSKGNNVALTVLKRISSNPLLIAVVSGLTFSILGLRLPEFIPKGLDVLAASAAPAALVVIGGSLVGVSIKGQLNQILLVSLGKLIFFPVIAALLLLLTPTMPHDLKIAVIIFAAMPMFSTYPIVCGEYGARSFCASTLLVTTVLSFISISLLLRFLV